MKLAEKLQKLSQKLKYGLPEQTDIYVYELGFNDRFLAKNSQANRHIHEKE